MNRLISKNEKVLEDQIRLRTSRRVRSLTVQQFGEGITIRGQASSYHVKQLALHAVREVYPSGRVWNQIVVNAE